MTTVIEGQGPLDHFRMCQVIASLSIQSRTGMRHSGGSVIKLAQQRYGITGRTAKTALAQMLELYKEIYGRTYGSDQPFKFAPQLHEPNSPS